jgi:hypothetical protein
MKGIMKFIHYTTQQIWDSIPKSGILDPKQGKKYMKDEDRSLYALSEEAHEKWESYMAPDKDPSEKPTPLLKYFIRDRIANRGTPIRVEFDITEDDGVFVYERAFSQLRAFKPYFIAGNNGENPPKPEGWDEARQKYYDSKTPLAEYDGSFILPEMCITTPIEKSRATQTTFPDSLKP